MDCSVRPKELTDFKADSVCTEAPSANIVEEHNYVHTCPSSSCTGHLLEERDKVLKAQEEVRALEEQLAKTKLQAEKPRPFTEVDIRDDHSKVCENCISIKLLFCNFFPAVFNLNNYSDWTGLRYFKSLV